MRTTGERILKSARGAQAYARGEIDEGFVAHVPDDIDMRAVRKKLDLTREAFAKRFGLSVDAVKEWEMGRRKPERATQHLLQRVTLRLRQVDLLALREDVQQENRDVIAAEIADDAISAALALAATRKADFPCSPGAFDPVAGLWFPSEM